MIMEQKNVDELLAKAEKPSKDAMKMHPFYQGKVQVMAKCCVRNMDDFAIWYTPGVAKPCLDIRDHPEKVFEHTNKGNMVAVVSDGTRVLGLGDIGPEAGLPVMEGKGLLFKYLGGVDAFPICLDTKDPDKIIETVLLLQPSFGGINLEDISQPKCFDVLDELRKRARIPVWHDDQQGTAAIIYAGLINAVKLVGKKIADIKLVFLGAGAANIRAAHVCITGGFNPENMILVDSKGIIHKERTELAEKYKQKWELAQITNREQVKGGIADAMRGADAVVGASKPGPGVILPEWIKAMAADPIVFPCANPVPEIWPWEAKEAGARVVATGRSDFPNQVNNSLGFPGIFRGTLDVRARTITDGMCIAAAKELAKVAEDKGLTEDYIIPSMDEWEVFPREAAAVGMQAVEEGVALRADVTREQLLKEAEETIRNARSSVQLLMKEGYIPEYKEE
ncbi:malate dehydrogenase [candidate division TA06 bacterium B3_TA06]|uniref:Malate dehydrogenase n=1 Tax=candidate division TA06 bacterium B3_TA06 TaxID=2012487 RepID=A0A532V8N6_UNCT6|nr:MAG: malate dehydrogenase [candidate division TA06 bacterium B3_TA06]